MRTCGSCASMDNIIGIIVSIVGYTIIFSFYSSSCSFLLAASCYLVVRGIYSMRFRGMMWIKSYRACVIYIYIYIYISELELGKESIVLLSSSNSISWLHFNGRDWGGIWGVGYYSRLDSILLAMESSEEGGGLERVTLFFAILEGCIPLPLTLIDERVQGLIWVIFDSNSMFVLGEGRFVFLSFLTFSFLFFCDIVDYLWCWNM